MAEYVGILQFKIPHNTYILANISLSIFSMNKITLHLLKIVYNKQTQFSPCRMH